jgi:3-oxoadipate enol-lactonase
MPMMKTKACDIYYTVQGAGEQTIVFAHGLLMDHSMWDLVAPTFADGYRVICFDFRGQGQSVVGGSSFEIDDLVEDTVAFIEAISTQPVHFVGLSMGGMVGMPLAARYPRLIRSLVLLDTSAQAEPWDKKIKYRLMALIVNMFGVKLLIPSTLKLMFGRSTLNNPEKKPMIMHWKQKLSALSQSILGPVLGVMLRRDARGELGRIACPVLIVVGNEDKTTPPSCAKTIEENISQAQFEIISDCGHSSALEKPEAVITLMQRFYLQLDQR